MSKATLKPIGARILVAPSKTEDRIGHIWIPDGAREKPQESIVIAVGTGKDGAELPVKKGDRIIASKWGGTEIKVDGKELKIVAIEDVLCVVEER